MLKKSAKQNTLPKPTSDIVWHLVYASVFKVTFHFFHFSEVLTNQANRWGIIEHLWFTIAQFLNFLLSLCPSLLEVDPMYQEP